jgi:hypothetical protein
MGRPVQIPGRAVGVTADDVASPLRSLLAELQLCGSDEEIKQAGNFSTVFAGPPQSVAIIEAGATAFSKWWSVVLGGSAAALWAGVARFWDGESDSVRRFALLGAALVTAALILAIAWIVGSDVRGRAAGMVATIEARAKLADSMVRAAQSAFKDLPEASDRQVVPLPTPLAVRYYARESSEEDGWRALAFSDGQGSTRFLIVKGKEQEWVDPTQLGFV